MERAPLSPIGRLEQERLIRGWTQEDVAEKLGIDPATVGRWERGLHKPQRIHRQQLCDLYGKSAQELGLADEPVPSTSPPVLQTAPPQEVSDAYTAFAASDLTMRLEDLVWSWLFRSDNARYHELPLAILLELERKDNNSMNEDPISRRDALRRLASLPVKYCSLSLFMPVLARPIDEILIQCTAGITACWYLRKSGNLAFVFDTLSRYIPTLQEIARIASTHQRKHAADLLAQCFLLQSDLVIHFGNYAASLSYAKQAEQYSESEAADNVVLEILAVRAQAVAYDFSGHWKQALQAAKKAKYLMQTVAKEEREREVLIPPIVQSLAYAKLADCQSYTGQKQDVEDALGLAHTKFSAQSSNGPAPIWVPHNEGLLLLYNGRACLHLGLYKEARASFEQAAVGTTTEGTRVEALISQVKAELHREDAPRDMEYCIDRWKQGVQGAIALQSEQRFNEARVVYTAMRAAWPAEGRVKDLREQIDHW